MVLEWLREIQYLLVRIDQQVFTLINSKLSNHFFDLFFPAITDLHDYLWFLILLSLSVLASFWPNYQKKSFLLFGGLLLSLATTDFVGNEGFKQVFQRPRPAATGNVQAILRSPASGYSFVSNHAANSFCFASFVYAFAAGPGSVFYVIAALVAYSRVYNGVHFPFDVLCGALLGILIAQLWVHLFKKISIIREVKI